MLRFDAGDGECLVYTFKEGLLSPLAQDLVLRVGRFEIEVEPAGPVVRAVFEAGSLRTLGAVDAEGRLTEALSEDDCRTVDGNVQRAVLRSDSHPTIRFESSGAHRDGPGWRLLGCLCMNDHRQELEVPVRRGEGIWVAEVELDQRAYGIRPYTGLMGTMRIKPEVRVRVTVPAFEPESG